MPLYGAVEIGGTKTDVAFGTSIDDLTEPVRLPTTSPGETLQRVIGLLAEKEVDAVGVASFGPLDLRAGAIANTPKPGWSGIAIREPIIDHLDVGVVVDTDVNGSALGEGRWGAATDYDNYGYVTLGTGIGAGIVVNGQTVSANSHPETGHINVTRHAGDDFPGACPFHGDCLEGMAAGPALEARFGAPSEWKEEAVGLAAFYVAQLMRSLIYVSAIDLVIVGGGVSKSAGFHDRLREESASALASYPFARDMHNLITPPGLGDLSGLAGALVLAGSA